MGLRQVPLENSLNMKALREFPVNPHVLVVHTDDILTDHVVESYGPALPPDNRRHRDWVRTLLSMSGVRDISLNPYKVRLRKERSAEWTPLLLPIESLLRQALGVEDIRDLIEAESPRRRFAWHGTALDPKRVFEGKRRAQSDRVASALFALDGVAEVILDGHEIEVGKSPHWSWRALGPEIERRLEATSA